MSCTTTEFSVHQWASQHGHLRQWETSPLVELTVLFCPQQPCLITCRRSTEAQHRPRWRVPVNNGSLETAMVQGIHAHLSAFFCGSIGVFARDHTILGVAFQQTVTPSPPFCALSSAGGPFETHLKAQNLLVFHYHTNGDRCRL